MMKIAILGTRGIPNYHGGFEQFAEYFSVYLAEQGHDVTVYNSHTHPYQESVYKGVHIVHQKDPEHRIGTAGQFIYDFNCIQDIRQKKFDAILQLGYTSSSIWSFLFPGKAVVITNMDGLEWKRSKYAKVVQKFLKKAEGWAVKYSDHLIADSIGIQEYLKSTYGADSEFIAYGATLFDTPSETVLEEYQLSVANYDLLIARLEPENNIETILDGVASAEIARDFLVIGKHETEYGNYLKEKYKDYPRIRFMGGIYDQDHLNNLRYFSNLYFHGHSVGGTNPSLLEAMASNALVIANDNIFNRSVLQGGAYYFKDAADVRKALSTYQKNTEQDKIAANRKRISTHYHWDLINQHYATFIAQCVAEAKSN